ncbi:MAG: hypothetical protein JWO14_24 [Solirubrobacterales bacterium]|nr:hypothetical protein [Solirubrobacterales bacterium]
MHLVKRRGLEAHLRGRGARKLDEGWALLADSRGRALLERISQLGRSQVAAVQVEPPPWMLERLDTMPGS